MIGNLEETFHDNETETLFCKTLGLNNLKGYVLTNNRFKTYMVSKFNDLNKTQIYKTPYRDS